LVMASYLYRWWKKTPVLLKTYAVTAVGILMVVTSIGIYGYLTSAYATVAAVPQNTLNEISFVETRQTSLDESILRLQTDNATIDSRQAQAQAALDNVLTGATELSQRSAFQNLRQEISGLDVERQGNNARVEAAISERDSLENVQVTLNSELNTNSDIGPFIYIARTLNLPLDTVVKWFVLVLIFVFDPLAISLILAYNNIVVKEMEARGEEIDETKGFSPFGKKKESRKMERVEEWPEPPEEIESLVDESPAGQSVARLIPREVSPPEPTPELEVVEEEPAEEVTDFLEEVTDFLEVLRHPAAFNKLVGDSIKATPLEVEDEPEIVDEVSTDIYDDPIPSPPRPAHGPISTTNEFPA